MTPCPAIRSLRGRPESGCQHSAGRAAWPRWWSSSRPRCPYTLQAQRPQFLNCKWIGKWILDLRNGGIYLTVKLLMEPSLSPSGWTAQYRYLTSFEVRYKVLRPPARRQQQQGRPGGVTGK